MAVDTLLNAQPVEMYAGSAPTDQPVAPDITPAKLATNIAGTVRTLDDRRAGKKAIWDECWELYRGKQNWDDKDDWQSRVVLPKAFNSVKTGVNAIRRFLRESEQPWTLDPVNPDDLESAARGMRLARLVKFLFEQGNAFPAIAEGLESGFICGVGLWRVGWQMRERRMPPRVQPVQLDPMGRPLGRSINVDTVREGSLAIRALDPYNVFWLPGSKMNAWTGIIEEREVPVYELRRLVAELQLDIDVDKIVKSARTARGDRRDRRTLRFDEHDDSARSGRNMLETVWLTEYWGPIVDDRNDVVEPDAHVILVNDEHELLRQRNPLWLGKAPYVGFSPLALPFRTDGIGMIEMARDVDRALNRLVNLAFDQDLMNLMGAWVADEDALENPEDLDHGVIPGHVFRVKTEAFLQGRKPLEPLAMQPGSPQTQALAGILDRAHQEGALISEIQQGLPRFRGSQTLGEVQMKGAQGQEFLSSLARDIDENAIQPLVEIAMDLTLQFIDTLGDRRVAQILGINDVATFSMMSLEDKLEAIQCDCVLKVEGVSSQVQKREVLESLVQFLNIVSQGGPEWMPAINLRELLTRVAEGFRPHIRDIDKLFNPPEVEQAIRQQQALQAIAPAALSAATKMANAESAAQSAQDVAAMNAANKGGGGE